MKTFSMMGILLMAQGILFAQDKPQQTKVQQLDEVIVSDSRMPFTRMETGRAVIVIDSLDLSRLKGFSLPEVLNMQAGIEVNGGRSRPGEILGVFARGGRGRQVQIRINDVRVTDPASFSQEYDLRLLDLSQVERIEILKGASSTLYGTNAASAVVQIYLKQNTGNGWQLNAGSTLGTQNTPQESDLDLGQFQNHARLSFSHDNFSAQGAVAHRFSNGLSSLETTMMEEDPFSALQMDLRVQLQLRPELSLTLFGNQSRNKVAYDESFGLVDADYNLRSRQNRAGAQLQSRIEKIKIDANFGFAEYLTEDRGGFPTDYFGKNWSAELLLRRPLTERLDALAGVNVIEDQLLGDSPQDFTLVDPFLQFIYRDPSGFHLNAGGRWNFHSAYGGEGVYSLNPSYRFKAARGMLKFFTTYATAYITPSLNQLFGAFGPNPELQPENNRTMELGLEYIRGNSWSFNLQYFDRLEENAVIFDGADFLYRNSPNTIAVNGVEASAFWNWGQGHRLEANYTWTNRQGDTAIRIPNHKFNFLSSHTLNDRWTLSLSLAHTGRRLDTVDFFTGETANLDAFSLLGFSLHHRIANGKTRVFLRGNNLLNSKYQEIFGFQSPGRNLLFGFEINL